MTMITPSYLGETIEYSSLHACRSTLEDPTRRHLMPRPRTRKLLALRGAGRVRLATPGPIRRAVASATHTPAVTPQLPASLVEELHGRLADDVRRLRTYVEPPFDGWGIA